MPRRKKRDFESEITEIERKLKKKNDEIKELQSKLMVVKSERDAEVHQALASAMKEKNLSIEDVVKLIQKAPEATI